MIKKYQNWIINFSISALWIWPAIAFAQNSQVDSGLSGISGLFIGSGIAGARQLTGTSGLIYQIIRMLLLVAGALAVLFVIIGGYQYITSGGNEETAEKGKKTLVNAIIGIVVIILSFVIINVIVNQISR